MQENEASIEQLSAITGQSWAKEEELRKLRADLNILDRKIATDLKASKEANGQRMSA